jgi:hypothetical protein
VNIYLRHRTMAAYVKEDGIATKFTHALSPGQGESEAGVSRHSRNLIKTGGFAADSRAANNGVQHGFFCSP